MTLQAWATKWGVRPEALADLYQQLGAAGPPLPPGQSEAAIQAATRFEASNLGWRLWRNNVGALKDARGQWVRYGLLNDTPQLNARFKSSDLVGIRPIRIGPDMVGQTIGQFAAVECKRPGWKMTPGDKRAAAQAAFLTLVRSLGGWAKFVTKGDQLG